MLNSKLTDVVKFQNDLFPTLTLQLGEIEAMSVALNFFTPEETDDIRQRIGSFQASKVSGKNARSGGSQLLKELEKVEHSKSELLKWIGNIRQILAPVVVTRLTIAQIQADANDKACAALQAVEQASIARIAESLGCIKEAMLRTFAESVIGKEEQDYLKEELPLVIATKQITGVILKPKELD